MYVALGASVTFGIVGLAIDATRAMIVQSEAQAAADAAALAAASQLDGTATSITRANNALATLVSNNQRMAAAGAGAVAIASTRFLTDLPANDDDPIDASFETTDPLRARFVEVTTAPLQHANTFLRAVGVLPNINITTTAVAGARDSVCGATPMMMCSPTDDVFDATVWRGRQVRLDYQANSWGPGNFGFLSSGGNGANALAGALASVNGANVCYGPMVTTEPGQNNGARQALNTRFDMYENPMFGGSSNNALYPPDVNVRKGIRYTNASCNNSTTNVSGRLPRDFNLIANNGEHFGNGRWDCLSYWNANFAASGVTRPAACTADTSTFSRYDMYSFELTNNLVNVQGAGSERGTPMCSGNGNPPQAGRRVIRIAVLDCSPSINGRTTEPVIAFARVFLTEPVTSPPSVQVVGEIIDVVEPGADDAVLRQVVQLYR